MRLTLVNFQGVWLSPDTLQAFQNLKTHAESEGWTLVGPAFSVRKTDLAPAGREITIQLIKAGLSDQQAMETLWDYSQQFGFQMLDRFPVVKDSYTLVCLGPWAAPYEQLQTVKSSKEAWEILVVAALSDVGRYRGEKPLEKFVQAQMLRLGHLVDLDGNLKSETSLMELSALEIPNTMPVQVVVDVLRKRDVKKPRSRKKTK
jgi:hypothetical protein